jgi:hypothetical protein
VIKSRLETYALVFVWKDVRSAPKMQLVAHRRGGMHRLFLWEKVESSGRPFSLRESLGIVRGKADILVRTDSDLPEVS